MPRNMTWYGPNHPRAVNEAKEEAKALSLPRSMTEVAPAPAPAPAAAQAAVASPSAAAPAAGKAGSVNDSMRARASPAAAPKEDDEAMIDAMLAEIEMEDPGMNVADACMDAMQWMARARAAAGATTKPKSETFQGKGKDEA